MRPQELFRSETQWGVHRIVEGFGKHTGKFIAESSGWGGARRYFRIFDTFEDAKAFVEWQTRPACPPEQRITL